MDRVAFRDPRRRDNPTTVAELAQIAPNIDFPLYVRGTGAPRFSRLNLLNPQYHAEALGDLGGPEAQAQVTRALDDESPLVRTAAAWAAGKTGDRAAIARLRKLAHDPQPELAAGAIASLGRLGTAEAATDLVELSGFMRRRIGREIPGEQFACICSRQHCAS